MSKLIAELLGAKDPLFSIALKQLEQASGNKGVDVKLTAELIEKKNDRMKRLGLDPSDTTGPELYQALLQQAKEHDTHLAAQIGATDPEDVHAIIPLALEAVKNVDMPRNCWAIKDEVAKRFLRETPPTKIMERLGYDDVNAMLENENLYEVYGALRFAEDSDWLMEFNTKYETLTPDDFEDREIALVIMPAERWGDIAKHFIEKKRHFHTHLKELGVVLVLPTTEQRMPGVTTKVLTLSFHYYNEVRLYSAFFKLQQVKPNFGKIFVDTLNADPGNQVIMAGQNVHWRVIQRYFGKLGDEYHPEVFEPHVQPEDLHWRKAEELMYKLDPELEFWDGLDYVGEMYDGQPLTFNFMDVSLSYSNGISYEERYIYHFREALWNEVFMRYMGEQVLEEQILRQLDNDMIAPENLSRE
jgi:hypothetical protein